jgi:hypothetical protein
MTANSAPDPSNPQPLKPQPTNPSQPDIVEPPAPGFGWTQYAEKINGRFAMIGFVALLLTERLSGQAFLTWLQLR